MKYSVTDIDSGFKLMMVMEAEENPLFVSFPVESPTEDDEEILEYSEILLVTSTHFVVHATYHVKSDWRISDYDDQGNCIASVPFDQIKSVLTSEEYQTQVEIEHIDHTMLCNAR